MPYEYILYEKKDRIAYITFNRPERMNALHYPAQRELWDALLDFKRDPEVWVVIFTGIGEKAFCAGSDIKEMAAHADELPPWGEWHYASPEHIGPTGMLPTEIWKPMIAAVNGYALGGGMEITLNCDIVVAAEHASFGLPEVTIGEIASGGGVFRAPRQLPLKVVMYMVMTGERLSAEEMYRLGYVNKVVPLPELVPTATQIAEKICQHPPLGVQAAKECILRGLDLPVDYPPTAWQLFKPAVTQRLKDSEDAREAKRAFIEKQKGNYQGR